MTPAPCHYFKCKKGLLVRRAAYKEQKARIRQGLPVSRKGRVQKLTATEMKHLLNFHSPRRLRVKMSNRTTVHICRRPDKNMIFICICGKEHWSRHSFQRHYKRHCADTPIPPGTAGISYQDGYEDQNEDDDEDEDGGIEGEEGEIEEDEDDDEEEDGGIEGEEGEIEEDEDYVDEVSHSCNSNNKSNSNSNSKSNNSEVCSLGAEFVKAVETTRCLQKQSSDFHRATLHRLTELHQTANEHIQELRQELQEERTTRRLILEALKKAEIENQRERSTGRLAVQALMEAQAARQEERQEWSVERLSLLACQETQHKERQENEERISNIESRLQKVIMALGNDAAPYRSPSTSEDSVLVSIRSSVSALLF
ncbi:unnamed protein product [Mortierella alpina]